MSAPASYRLKRALASSSTLQKGHLHKSMISTKLMRGIDERLQLRKLDTRQKENRWRKLLQTDLTKELLVESFSLCNRTRNLNCTVTTNYYFRPLRDVPLSVQTAVCLEQQVPERHTGG